MGIGFAGFSPGKEGGKQMWQDLMFGMKFYNQQSGGKLLEHAFVSVHPYSAGGGNQGVEYAEWERKNAGEILGFPIRTLATEGGNPTDRPDQQKVSSDINQQQLREMGTNPNATQSFWIIGDYYLRGATGPVESWERSALIDQNGNSSTWWSTLGQIAQGQISK